MKIEYPYTVRYQDVDFQRKLRLHTLENFLLEVAGRAADQQGYGIQYLYPQGLTWIIARLALEVHYLPTHGEEIAIETWVEQAQHMLSTRDYRIWLLSTDGQRRLIGRAKSQWAVLDLTKREIANVFDQTAFRDTVDGEVLDIRPCRRMIPQVVTGERTYQIRYSDVDYNGHCNSCKYIEHMLNTVYRPWFGDAIRVDIAYQREVKLGDTVCIRYTEQDDNIQYTLANEKGETCCLGKLTKMKNHDC